MSDTWRDKMRRRPGTTAPPDATVYRDNRLVQMDALSRMGRHGQTPIDPEQMGMLVNLLKRNEQVEYREPLVIGTTPEGEVWEQSGKFNTLTGNMWASDIPSFFHEWHHRRQQGLPTALGWQRAYQQSKYGLKAYETPGTVEGDAEIASRYLTERYNQRALSNPMFQGDLPQHLMELLGRR